MTINTFNLVALAWVIAAAAMQYIDKPNAWLWVTLAVIFTMAAFLLGVAQR